MIDLNPSAARMVGGEARALEKPLCGDVLRCVNARDAKGGCGTGSACPACAVRKAIREACQGQPVHRREAEMRLLQGSDAETLHFLITAVSFSMQEVQFILLAMEDVTELVSLRRRAGGPPGR